MGRQVRVGIRDNLMCTDCDQRCDHAHMAPCARSRSGDCVHNATATGLVYLRREIPPSVPRATREPELRVNIG